MIGSIGSNWIDCSECGSARTVLDLETDGYPVRCEDCGARTWGVDR